MVRRQGLISVVTATTCEKKRESSIRRAIASVFAQQDVRVEHLFVVNGTRFDPDLRAELESEPRIRVIRLDKASYPAARHVGWRESFGEYVSFLDDDDEYLPNALKLRREALEQDPALDYVVTNGYSDDQGPGGMWVQNVEKLRADPEIEAVAEHWLPPCGGMFRAQSVPDDFFAPLDDFLYFHEWTWLNFQLLRSGKKFLFLDEPTFHYSHTPGSTSRRPTQGSFEGELAVLRRMAELASEKQRPILARKIGLSLHSASDFHRANGDIGLAWSFFFRCLKYPGGWTHLFYVRHLLRASIARLFGR